MGVRLLAVRAGALLAALCAALAWRVQEPGYGLLFWPWVAAVVAYVASFPPTRSSKPWPSPRMWVLLALVLGIAAALRVPDLYDIPANISIDELLPALESKLIVDGAKPNVFSTVGWFTIPNLAFVPAALTIKFSGLQAFHAVRLASALTGLAGILATFLLGRRLLGDRAALAGAFLMAVAFWHLHNSRTGFPYAQSSFAPPFVLWLVVRGLQDRSPRGMALAGALCGLALQLYFPVRILLLLAPLFLVATAIWECLRAREFAKLAAIFAFGVFATLAPLVLRTGMDQLTAHSADILISHPLILEDMARRYRVDTFGQVLERNLFESWRMFTHRADVAVLNLSPAGLLDQATLVLFLSGIALALLAGRPEPLLLGAWVLLTFVFGVAFTNSPRGSYRFAPAMPAIFMLAAYTVECALSATDGPRRWYRLAPRLAVIAVLAASAGAVNYRLFFVDYTRGDGRQTPWPAALRYLAAHCDGRRFYMFPRSDNFTEADFVDVFCPDHSGIDSGQVPRAVASDRPVTFVVMGQLPAAVGVLKRCYPNSELVEHRTREGGPLFSTMDVSVDDLQAAPRRCLLPLSGEPRQHAADPGQVASSLS